MYRGDTPFTLRSGEKNVPTITPEMVTDFRCNTVADPFLLQHDDTWYMFFEAMRQADNIGEIAYATSKDALSWSYGGAVLREPFHLSYPHVFEHQGSVYMIPETRQANAIRLYVALEFPQRWQLVSHLLDGNYADATVMRHEGKWWIFAQRGLDETRLFYSDQLEDGWKGHPGNPFWPANRTFSRPGGRVLRYRGDWYRFVQDGLRSYGNNLRALRILNLDERNFAEEEIAESPVLQASYKGWNATGMHHLDAIEVGPSQWIAAVDGKTISA
jgi:hypothetical protein